MKKSKFVFIALALALVTWVGASAASAQDGPSITLNPSSIAEAGEATVTVTGSGWSVSGGFLGTCSIPEDVNAANLDDSARAEHCALAGGNLDITVFTANAFGISDGSFEREITVDVPAQGVFLVVGDAAQTEQAIAWLSVGAAEETTDDAAATETTDDAEAEEMAEDMDEADDSTEDATSDEAGSEEMAEEMNDDMEAEEMAEDMDEMGDGTSDSMSEEMAEDMDDDLADTGVNTSMLAIIGLAIALAGVLVFGFSRRLRSLQ